MDPRALEIIGENGWPLVALSCAVLAMPVGGNLEEEKVVLFRSFLNLLEAARAEVVDGTVSLSYVKRAAALSFFEQTRADVLLKLASRKPTATEASAETADTSSIQENANAVASVAGASEKAEEKIEEVATEAAANTEPAVKTETAAPVETKEVAAAVGSAKAGGGNHDRSAMKVAEMDVASEPSLAIKKVTASVGVKPTKPRQFKQAAVSALPRRTSGPPGASRGTAGTSQNRRNDSQPNRNWKLPHCHCCKGPHIVVRCPIYKKRSSEECHLMCLQKGLCQNCLSNRHTTDQCDQDPRCIIPGCNLPHHSSLHKAITGGIGAKNGPAQNSGTRSN